MQKFYLSFIRYLAVLLVLVSSQAWSQGKTVTGVVTAADDGSAIPGVNILEKGTNNGTISSTDGAYSINVNEGAVLVFSFVGYKATEVAVGNQTTVNVSLESDVTALSEVVVIGYGQVEKKDATGALVSLKPEDFNAGVINSPEQLIQGRAAGVQITSASGEPGAGINIRIRGTSSVRSGNNPLFVVDGVPLSGDDVTGGGSGAGLGSSSARNPLNFLNPNDIASIDILKDASATAIYGSRGANGVVIITTKTGRGAASALDYSYNLSFGKITKKYDLLDRQGFLSAWQSFNPGSPISNVDGGADTDWQDQILRTAVTHNHNLSFGAGDQSSNYRLSLGYMDQEGIVQISGLKRYTARFNGSKSFIDDRLTVATQLTLANTLDNGAPVTNDSGYEGDLIGSALKSNPTLPVRNPDGTFNQVALSEPNPAAILGLSKDYTNTLRGLGNISAELRILEGLTFKTVLGFDKSLSSRKTAFSRDLVVNGIRDVGRLYLNDIEIDNDLWENYFTYDKSMGNVRLNALLGYSYQSFQKSTKSVQFTKFRTSDLDQMINNLASADQVSGNNAAAGGNSSNVTDELQSFFGRVNLTFSDKYIFTATLRADGSTKFGGDNKYGYFPSGAFKWRISDEVFTPELFSDLNLRVGYGVTGNQEIPHNLYQERQRYNDWNITNEGNMDGGGINSVAFTNPGLKWESTAQINAGIDYGFANNRIRGSVDYYYKKTQDLLIQTTSAQPAVQPFVWRNLDAEVINRGFEFVIEYDAISKADFTWSINGNIAFNKNEVKNFNGLINTGRIHGQGLSEAYAQRIAGGQPLYAFFLRPFIGFDENGLQQYRNDSDVQEFTGDSPLPEVIAGLTNSFSFKAFDLSFFFAGQFGHKIYNNTANAFFTAGALASGRNTTKDVVGSGETRISSPDVSTRFLEDGSFIRLQNVTLGYNVNTQNTFISGLRFFVTGQNLFVITDYSGQDPEVNTNKAIDGVPSAGIDYTSYPRARVITFGVNVSFK